MNFEAVDSGSVPSADDTGVLTLEAFEVPSSSGNSINDSRTLSPTETQILPATAGLRTLRFLSEEGAAEGDETPQAPPPEAEAELQLEPFRTDATASFADAPNTPSFSSAFTLDLGIARIPDFDKPPPPSESVEDDDINLHGIADATMRHGVPTAPPGAQLHGGQATASEFDMVNEPTIHLNVELQSGLAMEREAPALVNLSPPAAPTAQPVAPNAVPVRTPIEPVQAAREPSDQNSAFLNLKDAPIDVGSGRAGSRAFRPFAPVAKASAGDEVDAVRVLVGGDHVLVPTRSLHLIVEFELHTRVPFTQPWICGLGLHAGSLYPVLQIGRLRHHADSHAPELRKGLLLNLDGLRCLLDVDAVVGFGRCRIVGASHFQGWSVSLPPDFLIEGATADRDLLPTVNGAAIKAMLHG